jgi:5'-3' exonuclease
MNQNLALIDTFAVLHKIHHYVSEHMKLHGLHTPSNSHVEYIKAWITYIDEFYFAKNCGNVKSLWLIDSYNQHGRNYWKSQLYPEYKSKRIDKDTLWAFVLSVFKSVDANSVEVNLFEADDIAGTICNIWKKNRLGEKLYLLTVDSDWMGLVDDEHKIEWLNIGVHDPRHRTKKHVYNWLYYAWHRQSKKKQQLWKPTIYSEFTCDQIWQWKSAVGDKADNLPAGSDIRLIDLLRSPMDQSNNVEFIKLLTELVYTEKPKANETKTRQIIDYLGYGEIIQPLVLDQPVISKIWSGIDD